VQVSVGLGMPAPVVVVPAPIVVAPLPPVIMVRPPRVVGGYYGYPRRHWQHGYWRPYHHYRWR
jgi:hypothetical protein